MGRRFAAESKPPGCIDGWPWFRMWSTSTRKIATKRRPSIWGIRRVLAVTRRSERLRAPCHHRVTGDRPARLLMGQLVQRPVGRPDDRLVEYRPQHGQYIRADVGR